MKYFTNIHTTHSAPTDTRRGFAYNRNLLLQFKARG